MLSLQPRCARQLCRLPQRYISSSATAFASVSTRRQSENDDEEEEAESETRGKSFKAFLKQYEHLRFAKPRNYVDGDAVPFPMNKSFKPPIPISDAARSRIYADYMADPETNSIRALSQRYHLSLKRVEAILRLKGLEAAFVKGKPLQTGFLWGMERLLGVQSSRAFDADVDSRADTHMADMLEQDENRDAARQRFQRQYWESIDDDGREPLLPASLENAKRRAERSAQAAHDYKSTATLMPRFKDTDTIKSPRQKVQTIVREGRLPIHFVDVGGKFLNVEERLKRMAGGERRHAAHSRASGEKVIRGFLRGRTAVERARRASVKRSSSSPPS